MTEPVTIIGGFLGASKTTLLNALLARDTGLRLAVVVNDFGDLAVDGDLVSAHGGDTVTLANGCICCSMGEDLLLALTKLVRRDDPPEAILIEASGVADPQPIADMVARHPELERDAVVVLADGELVEETAANSHAGKTIRQQLAAADLIILNKCDLLDDYEQNEVRQWLAAQVPNATVIKAWHGEVPVALLLGVEAGSVPETIRTMTAITAEAHRHAHEDAFRAVSFLLDSPLDRPAFLRFLADLPSSVLRAKGIIRLRDEPGRWAFQLVGRRHALAPCKGAAPGDRLVFFDTSEMPDEAVLRGLTKQATG